LTRESLTFQQSALVLRKLEGLPLVLVGGQALNYWCEFYREDEPALQGQVLTSKDVDFQSDTSGLYMSATALSGRAVTSKDPQFLGYVLFDPDGGGEVHIDFLAFPTGLTAAAVAALAVEADVTVDGVKARIMHPIHCMISRVENVVHAPDKYDTPHGLAQLSASVLCARAFLRRRITSIGPRKTLPEVEALIEFTCGKTGIQIKARKGTDLLQAIPEQGLPLRFYDERLRRVRDYLAAEVSRVQLQQCSR
jgi:hypothetical protein